VLSLLHEREEVGTYRAPSRASSSAGRLSPSASRSLLVLNQPTYSTKASSSCERQRQTRSETSSALKESTKLSASALSWHPRPIRPKRARRGR